MHSPYSLSPQVAVRWMFGQRAGRIRLFIYLERMYVYKSYTHINING